MNEKRDQERRQKPQTKQRHPDEWAGDLDPDKKAAPRIAPDQAPDRPARPRSSSKARKGRAGIAKRVR